MEVACEGHHRHEGIQKGKTKKHSEITRATTYNTRRARMATIYIYMQCKTTQMGRQGKEKDNECATQRNRMKEQGKGTAIKSNK